MHDDPGALTFEIWAQAATVDRDEARRRAAEGQHDAAIALAGQATRHALTGMMRGLGECSSHHDHDAWESALRPALEQTGSDEFKAMVERVGAERTRGPAHDLHDAGDAETALTDAETARSYAAAVWTAFSKALEADES